jgi:predicted dehydrogenase
MINVGVIGVGYLGQHHARIYSELKGVRLAAVVDTDINRAEEIGKKYGCDVYSDYRDAFDKVNAFSIVAPTTKHYEIALDCIKAGKDILIEKPITADVKEADELIKESDRKGTIIQVGHLERFNPAVLAVYPLVKSPILFEAERLSPFLNRGIDVDITLDLMIHDIDIILAILSGSGQAISVKDIKASVARILTDNIDVARAWLEFSNGAQALMTASRISSDKSRKLRIFQKESYLLLDYQNMEVTRFFKEGDKILHEVIKAEKKEPLKEELKDFIECVINRRKPVVSAVEGRNALQIILQINSVGNRLRSRDC